MEGTALAVVLGILQGILEWLPVSSEGAVTIALTAVGTAGDSAATFALFLHGGTAVAATVYYRDTLADALRRVPAWRPRSAFAPDTADLSFYALATLASVITGGAGYLVLSELATAVAGGAFVALIGLLLLGTGVLLAAAETRARPEGARVGTRRPSPDAVDAVIVGLLQGVAVLPGVSRSGTTLSALLLRGHAGPAALRLSFVLSIPAAAGAAGIALLETGLPQVSPAAAALAVALSAVVGYLTVDALTRLVRRLSFWRICVAFGALAVVGGVVAALAGT